MTVPLRRILAVLALVMGQALADPAPVIADEMVIKVGYGAGGPVDVYARLMAKHLPRFLPDAPRIQVLNVTGAAGQKLMRLFDRAAETDGSVLYALNFSSISNASIGRDPVEPAAVPRFIGGFGKQQISCWVAPDSPLRGPDDILDVKVRFGAVIGSSTLIISSALRSALDVPFKIIAGYNGSAELYAALERGEVDVVCGADPVVAASFRVLFPLRDDAIIPGLSRPVTDPVDVALLRYSARTSVRGVTLFLSSGTPEEIVETYRNAFAEMAADRAFKADMDRINTYSQVIPGEELEALYADIATLDPVVSQRLVEILK